MGPHLIATSYIFNFDIRKLSAFPITLLCRGFIMPQSYADASEFDHGVER